MISLQESYLTCTGGQAKQLVDEDPHGFVSLNQVLQEGGKSDPDTLIAGFPELYQPSHILESSQGKTERQWRVVSFSE